MKKNILLMYMLFCIDVNVNAQVRITPEEVLKKHFAGAPVKRIPVYLSAAEIGEISQTLGGIPVARFYTFYQAAGMGYAVFDTHMVRSKEETLCIIIDLQGNVKEVELVSFYEPDEYAPPVRWLRQFIGKTEKNAGDIQGMTGATLTTRSAVHAVRKALMVFRKGFKNN